MSDQGLPISVGTLADSVPRFLPLFEPFDGAAQAAAVTVRHVFIASPRNWRIVLRVIR